MITHHPPFELLCDYAAGAPGEGLALAIATHVAMCATCREQVSQIEAVAGAMLEGVAPAAMSDGALALALDQLDDMDVEPARAAPRFDALTAGTIPPPLRRYLSGNLSSLPWKSMGRLFQEARLPLSGKAVKASLMRLRPGSLMPRHTHRGHEYTLVLAGGFRDGDEAFAPGDFSVKDVAHQHQPVVDEDEECLCLVVLDAPVKLTGAIGRLVNPFLRF